MRKKYFDLKEIARPTIRLDRTFNEELKAVMKEKGTSLQEVCENYLHKWLEENKEVVK